MTLERQHLRQGEAAGAVHSPLFSSAAVPEAWWVLVCISSKGSAPCLRARIDDINRDLEVSLKFKVDKVGKHRCTLHVVCEAYEGIDLEQTITFEAKQPTEAVEEDSGDEEGDEDEEDDDY